MSGDHDPIVWMHLHGLLHVSHDGISDLIPRVVKPAVDLAIVAEVDAHPDHIPIGLPVLLAHAPPDSQHDDPVGIVDCNVSRVVEVRRVFEFREGDCLCRLDQGAVAGRAGEDGVGRVVVARTVCGGGELRHQLEGVEQFLANANVGCVVVRVAQIVPRHDGAKIPRRCCINGGWEGEEEHAHNGKDESKQGGSVELHHFAVGGKTGSLNEDCMGDTKDQTQMRTEIELEASKIYI